MRRRLIQLAIACTAVCCLAGTATARSGGSMGGGSFRSSSRSSSSHSFGGGSSRPSFPSSSYGGTRYVPIPIGGRSYGYGYGYGGAYGATGSVWPLLVLLLIVLAVAGYFFWRARMRRGGQRVAASMVTARAMFGVQTTAWGLVDRLDAIARSGQSAGDAALHTLLLQSLAALRHQTAAIGWAGAESQTLPSALEAERQFGRWTGQARLSYDREVVRADRFGVQTTEREAATDGIHDEDGQLAVPEFFVVTLVVAARSLSLPPLRTARDLEPVLTTLAGISASDLVALEVVWTPASRSDAMSREDMETTFPLLHPL